MEEKDFITPLKDIINILTQLGEIAAEAETIHSPEAYNVLRNEIQVVQLRHIQEYIEMIDKYYPNAPRESMKKIAGIKQMDKLRFEIALKTIKYKKRKNGNKTKKSKEPKSNSDWRNLGATSEW